MNDEAMDRMTDALSRTRAWLDEERHKEKPPRASQGPAVVTVAAVLRSALRSALDEADPALWTDEALLDAGEDLGAAALVAQLLDGEEFEGICNVRVLINWSVSPIWHTDGPLRTPAPAKIKAFPKADREAWRGGGLPPDFLLTIALPWWLLASAFEREAGLHDRLAYMGRKESGPYLRKPDIAAHASTLARYGLLNARDSAAHAAARAHPSTAARLLCHHFGPDGQGTLFAPAPVSLDRPEDKPPAQTTLPATPRRSSPRRRAVGEA